MSPITRYRQWRTERRAAALQSSKDALITAQLKQVCLLQVGQKCVDEKHEFMGGIICNLVDKSEYEIHRLERKIAKLTPK